MSTKYTEHETKTTISCKVCNGEFVPGGVRIKLPDNVCLWCYSRSNGAAYRRFMVLWEGLKFFAKAHQPRCDCQGCKIYRLALPIMEPSASIQESEIKPSDEGRKEVII